MSPETSQPETIRVPRTYRIRQRLGQLSVSKETKFGLVRLFQRDQRKELTPATLAGRLAEGAGPLERHVEPAIQAVFDGRLGPTSHKVSTAWQQAIIARNEAARAAQAAEDQTLSAEQAHTAEPFADIST